MLNSRQTVTQISILKNTNKKQLITCYIYIYEMKFPIKRRCKEKKNTLGF